MAVSLWLLVVFLVVVLALPVAIVIAAWARRTSRAEFPRSSPPRTDNAPAEGGDAEPDLPGPATGPPASPLPRRIAGQSGVAYPAGDPAHPPGVSRPPQASGSPPWEPAPKPPGVPERIKRLGLGKATERRSQGPGRTLTRASVCAVTKAAHSSRLLRDEGLVVIVPSYGALASQFPGIPDT